MSGFEIGDIVKIIGPTSNNDQDLKYWTLKAQPQKGKLGEVTLVGETTVGVQTLDKESHRWWPQRHVRKAKRWEIKKQERKK